MVLPVPNTISIGLELGNICEAQLKKTDLIDTSVSGRPRMVSISESGRTAISMPGRDSMNGLLGY